MRFEMKTRESHPIEPLELMAYLDGELPRERAAAAAAHLEECRECQALAADLRGVSEELAAWQIGPSEFEMSPRIHEALEDQQRARESTVKKPRWSWWASRMARRLVLAGTGVSALLIAGILMQSPRYALREMQGPAGFITARQLSEKTVKEVPRDSTAAKVPAKVPSAPQSRPSQPRGLILPVGPMVIRTGELALTTTDFEQARSKLEFILKHHNGYLADLAVSGSAESARTLTATLRVPADQLDAAVAELRSLGRVDSESQKGEEVSQQYVDLQARLANARETEQTLLDILRHRTGKLSDVLQVEQEIASVREEIERMEAEKKNMEKQVAFSTVSMTVTEDFKQHVHVVPDSTSTRIRNAAVDGYETMVAGLINMLLFLFSAGPSLLLWGAVLFFPARWGWKKWRKRNQI